MAKIEQIQLPSGIQVNADNTTSQTNLLSRLLHGSPDLTNDQNISLSQIVQHYIKTSKRF